MRPLSRLSLRQTVRGLRRRPAYALVCILTLALVLGANAALLAVINATMLRPPPFTPGSRVLLVYATSPGESDPDDWGLLHPIDLPLLRERARTLSVVEGFSATERILGGAEEPEVVRGMGVSAGLFALLEDRPWRGRVFSEAEDEQKAPVAVIGYGLWQRRFGGDPGAVGRTLDLDGVAHTVIGIMPRGFPPPFLEADIWTPLGLTRSTATDLPSTTVTGIAALAPGAEVEQAGAEVRSLLEALAEEYPRTHLGWSGGVKAFRDWQYGRLRAPLLVLLAAVSLVVVIAAGNVAGLTLAQVVSRRGELAVRSSLGANPADLARLIATEVLIVTAAGAALGLVLAAVMLPALLSISPEATRLLGPVGIDWRVQAGTLATALLASLLAGVVPAMRLAAGDTSSSAHATGRRTAGSRQERSMQRFLLGLQTSLCVVLLVCAGILLRGMVRAAEVDPGFEAAGVLTAQIRLPAERYETQARRSQAVGQLLERVRALPGVAGASITLNPFQPGNYAETMVRIEHQPTPDGSPLGVQFRRVSTDYFATMRIPLVRGRSFSEEDREATVPVAMVSRSFADRFWPGADPVGRRVGRADKWLTVIGVAEDVSDVDLLRAPEPTLYLPWAQSSSTVFPFALVVRTPGDPRALVAGVRSAVSSVDPQLPVARIQPLETFLDDSLAPQRFRTVLLGWLAALGLVIGAMGVSGTTWRNVSERTREYGIRLALGCEPGALWRAAALHQLGVVAAGAGVGLAASWVCARGMAHLLTDVEPPDPLTVAGTIGLLAAVALVAALVPAARVLRVDPAGVLRGE